VSDYYLATFLLNVTEYCKISMKFLALAFINRLLTFSKKSNETFCELDSISSNLWFSAFGIVLGAQKQK